MRKLAFLEMLASGKHSAPDGEFQNMPLLDIPPYPFADLLAPVEEYAQGIISTKKGFRYNFPELTDVGDMATLRITGRLEESSRPSYTVYRHYQWRGIKVSVQREGVFIKVKRIA